MLGFPKKVKQMYPRVPRISEDQMTMPGARRSCRRFMKTAIKRKVEERGMVTTRAEMRRVLRAGDGGEVAEDEHQVREMSACMQP